MDPTLLKQPIPSEQPDNGEGSALPANRMAEQPVTEEATYRDLAIEQPQLPLRVVIQPPMDYDGQRYSELTFDFDGMVGKDFQRAEREFVHLYKADKNEMALPELKHLYHAIIAAHLANVPLGVIQKLPRRIYVPLRLEVLKACGSSPEEEKA